MGKKVIKLINNERINAKLVSPKACDSTSVDVCVNLDNASCTVYSADQCIKDYEACKKYADDVCGTDYSECNGTEDYCSGVDVTSCFGAGTTDM